MWIRPLLQIFYVVELSAKQRQQGHTKNTWNFGLFYGGPGGGMPIFSKSKWVIF
jgi:hypothetical protein